ncbi:hypothetical protein JXQ70_02665 [bacterium]|nr:hypothetical protein [bacterium]
MSKRNVRYEQHMVTIASQAFFVLGLWFVIWGFSKFQRLTSTYEFF